MTDRAVFRSGSWAAIVGALLALAANLLHPRPESFDDPVAEELRIIGESDGWVAIHLGILAASLLIAFGLFAFARSLKGGPAEGVSRVALGSLLISTPVAIIGFMVDGYAMNAAADSVAADPAQLAAATAVAHIGWGVFMGVVMTFLGITPALFGWAAATDGRYPSWLGWGAVLFGLVSVGASVYGILDGPSSGFFLVFAISSGILTLWVLVLGVFLGRRAKEAVTIPGASAGRTASSVG